METNIPNDKQSGSRPLAVLLLSILAGAAAVFFMPAIFVVPALWAYAMCRTKPAYLAAFVATAGAALLAGGAGIDAAGWLVLTGGTALCIYFMQKEHLGNANTVLISAGTALVGLYAVVCLPGILSGAGAFAAAQELTDAVLAVGREALAAVTAAGADPETAAMLAAYYDAFSEAVPSMVVPVLCAAAGVTALSNLLLFRLFSKKHVSEFDLQPMRPFRLWEIPRNMTLGLFLLLVGSLVMEWSGWAYADGLSNTVDVIVGMPLLLQGLCVTDFLLARRPGKAVGRRIAAYVAIGLLFSFLQMAIMMVGCFEQIFHLRARMSGAPPARPFGRM